MARPRGTMPLSLAERLLAQAGRDRVAREVHFHVMGEPLLYPSLTEAVRLARGSGLEAWMTTNGSLLTPELLTDLRDAGLSHLTISLQTPDGPTFALRGSRRLSFEEYRERIIGAVRRFLADESGMHLSICFLSNPLRRFHAPGAAPMRVAESGKELRAHMGRWVDDIFGGTAFERQVPALLARTRKAGILKEGCIPLTAHLDFRVRVLGNWAGHFAGPIVPARFGYCPGLAEQFGVLWNGDYVICCADYDGRTALGERLGDVAGGVSVAPRGAGDRRGLPAASRHPPALPAVSRGSAPGERLLAAGRIDRLFQGLPEASEGRNRGTRRGMNLLLISPLTSKSLLGADFYFRMPTLGLLRVAGATPPEWTVTILDEKAEPIDFSRPADLVGITGMTPAINRAYEIADSVPRPRRARGHGRDPRQHDAGRGAGALRRGGHRRGGRPLAAAAGGLPGGAAAAPLPARGVSALVAARQPAVAPLRREAVPAVSLRGDQPGMPARVRLLLRDELLRRMLPHAPAGRGRGGDPRTASLRGAIHPEERGLLRGRQHRGGP